MRPEIFVGASELLERAAEAGVFLSYGQKQLHFKLSVDVFPESLKSEILENKAALIEFLKHRELDNGSTLSRSRIVAQTRETNELPASFAQQRLWFIDQLGGGSPHYNMPAGLRIQGRFNEEIAERALCCIIERHEPLRTVFRNGAEGPLQHIREHFDFKLERIDLSGLKREEQEQRVREAANTDAFKPFDLSSDLMLRACFIRLSQEEGVLLFNLHHIASDGWSTGILMNEFSTLYEAFSQGKPDPLPPLVVQYADYAQWQREWLAGEMLEQQLNYWEQQLGELPQVHGLPLDRPRPAVQTFNGALHSFTLDHSTLAALKQLALAEQATLFMVLQGVFALLLSRHSNSDDIVIGTPVASRLQKELEPLVGFFVNTLVLRTDCRGGWTFREYLRQLKRLNLNAQANQDVPFEYLVERLRPQRSTSHAPLFQIMFSMHTNGVGVAELPELSLTPLTADSVAVKFDLTLDVIEDADGLRLSFAYNTDLFEESTIACLGEHFENLVRGIVANPERPIETLPLLSAAEQQHLLYELNDTAADYPGDTCLHELFEAQVEVQPESVAVVFGESQLSYRELNEQANQVAHYLREQGVGPDVLVGLCMDRSLAMVVDMLGILKAGGAYVPLDPSYPPERLEYLIEDSAPAILLTQAANEEYLPVSNVSWLRLDADSELLAAYPTHNLSTAEVRLTSEHLAYVIYTSGSTGKPKGVMIEHRGLSNYLAHAAARYLDGEIEGSVVSSPLSFDATLTSLLTPLLVGKTVELLPDDETLMNRLAERLFTSAGNKLFKLTPTHLEALLYVEQPLVMAGARHVIIVGGEQLGAQLLRRWKTELLAQASFVNEYGPTEAVVGCSVWWLRDEAGLEQLTGLSATPIGRPIANAQLYVLDAAGQLVPQNGVGELYIGGVGLARGYLRRAGLTAERFVPNPFATSETTSGGRLYRTGDEVRWLADGNLEFLGRLDQQVKMRGFRIELGEIEAALREHPAVRNVVVTAREDKPGDKRLVAYVVLEQDEVVITGSELRQYLRGRLPDYMFPAMFVLEALPLLPNGKVDRKALPAPDHARPDIEEAFAAPRTPIEEMMAAIWSQILQLEKVGIHDNFFSIGGHSLLAAQVMNRVRDTFNVDLPLSIFFETPTVAALAARVTRIQIGEADDATLRAALAELSQLSSDEMDSMLAAQRMSAETWSLS